MKVKELIEILSKENQDHEIRFQISENVTGKYFCGWTSAESIKVIGYQKLYDYDGSLMNDSNVRDVIIYYSDEELSEIEINEIRGQLDSIEGVFIRVSE